MKLRLSVTMAESPVLLSWHPVGQPCLADANHDNDRHLNPVCHGMARSSQGIPLSNISVTTSDKVTRGDTSNLRQRSGQKQSQLSSNDQLVEKGRPFHLPCQSSIQINHHIIKNEEASCEKKALKAKWVPSVPVLTNPSTTRFCGSIHISTQYKEPSAVNRIWVPKLILDGISPRSIDLADSNRRSPILTQDKR